jgi:hypothetical protein
MSLRYPLTLLGAVLLATGLSERGSYWLLAWLGGNFLMLGLAHFRGQPGIFGKRTSGTLPGWSRIVFLPLFLYSSLVWQLLRRISRSKPFDVVNDRLVVGRRLLPGEATFQFDQVVDLTAEFQEPEFLRNTPGYRCFPILDGGAPTPEALHDAVAQLGPGRIFIHCAQGHGRTGLFALAVLLHSGAVGSLEEGLRLLTAARPGIRLNREQRRCLDTFARELRQKAG